MRHRTQGKAPPVRYWQMHDLSAVAAASWHPRAAAACRQFATVSAEARAMACGQQKLPLPHPAAACHLWPLRSAVCSTTLAIDLQWQVHARRLNVTHAYISALLAQTRLLSDNL
jgi:hypothetical protein